MYMTMAFTFDSVHHMQNLLVRRLSPDQSEGLWQDFVRWAELFGMPRSAAPASYPEFRAGFDGYLASDKLWLTDEARVVGSYLAGAKRGDYDMSPPLRPLFRVIDVLVKGSLPDRVRALYGFRWTPAHQAAYRAAVQTARTLYVQPPRFAPRPARAHPARSQPPGVQDHRPAGTAPAQARPVQHAGGREPAGPVSAHPAPSCRRTRSRTTSASSGAGPSTATPGTTSLIVSGRSGEAAPPSSARHAVNWADEVA